MELLDFARDGDGFLLDRNDWTDEFAQLCAQGENLEYSEDLIEVVVWAREHYSRINGAPTIRDFSKGFYTDKFGKPDRKGPTKYLANLTAGSGMKIIDKIAGLPKPTGCV